MGVQQTWGANWTTAIRMDRLGRDTLLLYGILVLGLGRIPQKERQIDVKICCSNVNGN
jgi:hypothetical protein